ncbi:hypothetical protein, partial, partial [Parasitella parasitica]
SLPNYTAGELSTCPNMMFADYGDCNINICFPQLREYYRQHHSTNRSPNTAICSDNPAASTNSSNDAGQAYPFSLDYNNAARAGVGNSKGKLPHPNFSAGMDPENTR